MQEGLQDPSSVSTAGRSHRRGADAAEPARPHSRASTRPRLFTRSLAIIARTSTPSQALARLWGVQPSSRAKWRPQRGGVGTWGPREQGVRMDGEEAHVYCRLLVSRFPSPLSLPAAARHRLPSSHRIALSLEGIDGVFGMKRGEWQKEFSPGTQRSLAEFARPPAAQLQASGRDMWSVSGHLRNNSSRTSHLNTAYTSNKQRFLCLNFQEKGANLQKAS